MNTLTPYEYAVQWITNLPSGMPFTRWELYAEMLWRYGLPESCKGSSNLAIENCCKLLVLVGDDEWVRL